MLYRGVLTKVFDNTTESGKLHWAMFINLDEGGAVKVQLWDKKYAGIDSENNPAVCDIHDLQGKRVVVEAKKGNPKADDPDDCWPATAESICLEEAPPEKSVREMAEEFDSQPPATPDSPQIDSTPESTQEHAGDESDALRLATMAAISAEVAAHEARVEMLKEVERHARRES